MQDSAGFPKSRLGWLWENMKGRRAMFVAALAGTVVYNIMQLVVPHFSGRIVDLFRDLQDKGISIADERDTFIYLIAAMVGLTLLRVIIVYLSCMAYEHVSQYALFRIRNFLYDKIQRQDMKFYGTYRTGDLMTRVTGDLDAVRHNVAWVIRMVVESFTLFTASAVYFFFIDWKLAITVLMLSPFIFLIIFRFRKNVAPKHKLLREKLAGMNTDAQENIIRKMKGERISIVIASFKFIKKK